MHKSPRIYFDLDSTVWFTREHFSITPFDVLLFQGEISEMPKSLDAKIAALANAGVVFPGLAKEQIANLLQNHYKRFNKIILPLTERYPENWAAVYLNDREAYATVLRPGIREFIAELKDCGMDIRVCTASTREYCSALLRKLGLYSAFNEIVTREDLYANNLNPIQYDSDWLLFDDLETRELESKFSVIRPKDGKLYDMSYYLNRHIKVVPFLGVKQDNHVGIMRHNLNDRLKLL